MVVAAAGGVGVRVTRQEQGIEIGRGIVGITHLPDSGGSSGDAPNPTRVRGNLASGVIVKPVGIRADRRFFDKSGIRLNNSFLSTTKKRGFYLKKNFRIILIINRV